jgi:PAS domain S-box-containing protein
MDGYQKELALVKGVLKENPKGMTVSDISREIRINRNSVAKYLDVLLISGHVEMRTIGPAKLFSLSSRVPLSAVLNFSSDYMLVLDRDLKIVQANDRLVDFIKVERGNLIGHDIKDCKSSPLNAPDMMSKIKGALEGKEFSMEKDFRFKGKVFYSRVKLVPTTFDDGEPGVTIIMEDITERKRFENELRIRNRAIEASVNGMAFSDLKGNLTYVNPSFLGMWGYSSRKDVIGRNAVDFWHTRDRAVDIIESLRERGGWTGELVARRKDGSLFNAHLTASMVKDKKGMPICMMGSFIDITESKKAEESVRDSENKFKTIFENVNDMIIYLDKRGRILDINKKVEDVLGYRRDEVIGKNFAKIGVLGVKDIPRMLRLFTDLLGGDRTVDMMEMHVKNRKGKMVPIEVNVKIVRKDGKTEGVVVIIRRTRKG